MRRNLTVLFNQPTALWLTPIAFLPYLVAISVRSLVDVPPFQVVIQLLLRALLLMGLALALAMPSLRSPLRGKTVVFVVDVSS